MLVASLAVGRYVLACVRGIINVVFTEITHPPNDVLVPASRLRGLLHASATGWVYGYMLGSSYLVDAYNKWLLGAANVLCRVGLE